MADANELSGELTVSKDGNWGSGSSSALPSQANTMTAGALLAPSARSQPQPESIGGFRIIRLLGEGGMGVVWEAEQERPRRHVALKVMRRDHLVDDLHVRMFRREAESLARLRHPNIAAIYESGHTDEGYDYFAMEMVRGATLDQWQQQRASSLDAGELKLRLRMFQTICEAVHSAHQRGVIHRDLKPSNLLVSEDLSSPSTASASPVPVVKILDFGLARITDVDVAATTVSEIGTIKGTLQYMSPEQARGDVEAIDVRSDVYALGVILYELLAGYRPYQVERASLVDAVRVICEEPPRPLNEGRAGTTRLDRDIETIILKALEKEADRRYSSAAALAEDVGRYLASQPIVARPPSTLYQVHKLVQRHRLAASLLLSLLVIIIGFGIGMTVLYHTAQLNLGRALAAETSAQQNFDLARGAVDHYLTRVANSPDLQTRGLERLRQQLLKTAREFYEKLAAQAKDKPELTSELAIAHQRLADISRVVGDQDLAVEEYDQAIATLQQLLDTDPPDRLLRRRLASALSNLGLVHAEINQPEPAETAFERALGLERELLAGSPEDLVVRSQHATTLDNHGQLLERVGRTDEAEAQLKQAFLLRRELASQEADNPDQRLNLVYSGVNLSAFYARLGRLEEARGVVQEAVGQGETLIRDHPRDATYLHSLAAAYSNLAGIEMLLWHYDASRDAYARELKLREPLITDHPAVVDYRLKLASVYTNLGELETRTGAPASGLPWYERAIETLRWVLDREPDLAVGRYFLSYTHSWNARALDALGRHSEAAEQWRQAIAFDDRGDPTLRAGLDSSRSKAGA